MDTQTTPRVAEETTSEQAEDARGQQAAANLALARMLANPRRIRRS